MLTTHAQANATKIIAEALQRENGADAAALTVAKQYVGTSVLPGAQQHFFRALSLTHASQTRLESWRTAATQCFCRATLAIRPAWLLRYERRASCGRRRSYTTQAMSIFKTVANKGGNNSSGADANAAIDAKSSPRK